jgi:hypothetical protein
VFENRLNIGIYPDALAVPAHLIRDEIKRGCDYIGEGKRSFCGS